VDIVKGRKPSMVCSMMPHIGLAIIHSGFLLSLAGSYANKVGALDV
jgi:hypothetical protein